MRGWNIFQQLAGAWTFERQIINYANTSFSGTVTGIATFVLVGKDQYLLNEAGHFTTANQQTFSVTKQFLFSFNATRNSINVDGAYNNISTGRLFELNFDKSTTSESSHLCSKDTYDAKYSFPATETFDAFGITYKVKGPTKDYLSATTFRRKPTF